MEKLRIGILSTAKIARSFLKGVNGSDKIEVVAVGSRDLNKAQGFAKEFGIANAYGSYEELLQDKNIEAIYNPLPNSLHAEWSVKASHAGKHVLCEKPLAMSLAETEAMFVAAKANNVFLVEAYPWASQPQTLQMRKLIADGAIGNVTLVRASFCFSMSNTSNIRLIPELGGGSLRDAGCYPISLVRVIVGRCPVRVHAMANWTSTNVDNTIVASLDFGNNLLAQVASGFSASPHRHAQIVGDAGMIDTEFRNSPDSPASFKITRGVNWDSPTEIMTAIAQDGFLAEAESFCDMVRLGAEHWNGITETESRDIAKILAAIDESARSQETVFL